MPIRSVKQHSDRGSIKNLANPDYLPEEPPSAFELRFKKLYEYSQAYKDTELQNSLGIITTNYIADKNALPLSAYRIRTIIDDIKSKSSGAIEELQKQLSGCFGEILSEEALDYLSKHKRIKTASAKKPVFWRASRKR